MLANRSSSRPLLLAVWLFALTGWAGCSCAGRPCDDAGSLSPGEQVERSGGAAGAELTELQPLFRRPHFRLLAVPTYNVYAPSPLARAPVGPETAEESEPFCPAVPPIRITDPDLLPSPPDAPSPSPEALPRAPEPSQPVAAGNAPGGLNPTGSENPAQSSRPSGAERGGR